MPIKILMDEAKMIAAGFIQAIHNLKIRHKTIRADIQGHLLNFPKYSKMRQTSYQVYLPSQPNQSPSIQRIEERSVKPPMCIPKESETTPPELSPSQNPLPYPLLRVKK